MARRLLPTPDVDRVAARAPRPRPVSLRILALLAAAGAACRSTHSAPDAAHAASPDVHPRPAAVDSGAAPLTRSESGGRWGFVDPAGAWAIPATFAWAEAFSEGLAAVRTGDRWGFVNRTGQAVIPARFLDADSFSEGLAAVRVDGVWRYIDPTGAVRIPGPFEAARPFACGVARVRVERTYLLGTRVHGTFEVREGGTAGLDRARVAIFDALTASADHRAPPPDGLDDIALDVVYADANQASGSAGGGSNPWAHPDWRLREPQWEQHVWQTINARGEVVSPDDAPRCGSTPAPRPPVPADLRATLDGLHPGRERTAFFREVVAIGAPAVPVLVEALADRRRPVRLDALEALVRVGRPAAAAVPALTAALADADGDVLLFAAWALGRIGPAAVTAVPALVRAHGRRERLVEAALAAIAPEDPAVRALLAQSQARRRAREPLAAVRALVERHDAVAAVPRLIAALETPRRDDALALLGDLGADARAALPRIRALLETLAARPEEESMEPDTAVARCASFGAAARALWRIGGDARAVLPRLTAQLTQLRGENQLAVQCDAWALQVLATMGPAAAPAAAAVRRWGTSGTAIPAVTQTVLRALEAP